MVHVNWPDDPTHSCDIGEPPEDDDVGGSVKGFGDEESLTWVRM